MGIIILFGWFVASLAAGMLWGRFIRVSRERVHLPPELCDEQSGPDQQQHDEAAAGPAAITDRLRSEGAAWPTRGIQRSWDD